MGEPIWKGLFEWSMKYQDGTHETEGPKPMSEADTKWLDEAIKAHTIDLGARMKEIKSKLDASPPSAGTPVNGASSGNAVQPSALTLEDKELLLDELMEIVEHIDHARDLQSIGGLPTLLNLLEDPEPSLRAKSAEIVATCAQNNPPVQKWMMDGGVFPKLFTLLSDADSRVRVKALLGLSCMVRENSVTLARFRALGGVPQLLSLLHAQEPARLKRKVVQLLRYVFREEPGDAVSCMDARTITALAAALDAAVPTAAGAEEAQECQQQASGALEGHPQGGPEAIDIAEASLALLQQAACVAEVRPMLAKDAMLQASIQGLEARLSQQGDEGDLQQKLAALQQQLRTDAPVVAGRKDGSIVLLKKKP